MNTLYRCSIPTDVLCPCGTVARELRKLRVAFEEVRVPQKRAERAEVVALSGQPRVPLLVLDDEEDPICDSRRIVEHLRWLAAKA